MESTWQNTGTHVDRTTLVDSSADPRRRTPGRTDSCGQKGGEMITIRHTALPCLVEREARAMSPAERREYLRAAGWVRRFANGSEDWQSPIADDADRHYTLAAAIRRALIARSES